MLLTILLALAGMVLLCLMIAAATYFMPFRGMAGFFPPDVQEALQPRLDAIDKQPKAPRIFGGVVVGILCLLFVCLYLCGGIDGLHHQFAFRDFLLRFLVISFGIKAFDIIALDYFLLTKTQFFPRRFPETAHCAGWQQFGYNRKQQLSQCVMMLISSIAMAFLFSKL